MKKHRIASIFSALFIVILCASLFAACQRVEQIDANQVERIEVWHQLGGSLELTADDSARFIDLYNSSKYEGKGTGDGGTPDFGILVYFRDGTYLSASDFFGKLEVSLRTADGGQKAWYYISSKELYTFVSELADKATETNK